MRKLETHDWWPEMVALKDELSLRELGEKFSVTPGAIMAAFRRNGIERRAAPPGPRAYRERRQAPEADALPPEPGEDASVRPGSKDGQIAAFAEMLGQVPDHEIAKKAGVSLRTVAAYRARNDIPGFRGKRTRRKKPGPKSKVEPYADIVGTVPDRVVAEKAGVTVNAVRNWRRLRGISAAGRSLPTLGTTNGEIFVDGDIAWQVRLSDGRIGVVVADSLVDAARKAEDVGDVTAMDRLGPVL